MPSVVRRRPREPGPEVLRRGLCAQGPRLGGRRPDTPAQAVCGRLALGTAGHGSGDGGRGPGRPARRPPPPVLHAAGARTFVPTLDDHARETLALAEAMVVDRLQPSVRRRPSTGQEEGRDINALLSGVQRFTRGAVENARAGTEAIVRSAAERTILGSALSEPPSSGAGGLQRLDSTACHELLAERSVGRLAYLAREGTPDIVPVNYVLWRGDILIRSGPGPKAQAAERGDLVAFEVDDVDESTGTGRSVVVYGPLRRLHPQERSRLPAEALPRPFAAGPRHHVLRLTAKRIDGRVLS